MNLAGDQLGLFDRPPRSSSGPGHRGAPAPSSPLGDAGSNPARGTLEERFAEFHAANPHVYTRLRDAALAQARGGAPRLSIAKLAEELRADHRVKTGGDDFKINNSFRAPYARLLMEREPLLRGRFETRAGR